jgi:preprotein translocase subunit SecD
MVENQGQGIGKKPDHSQHHQGRGLVDSGVFEVTVGGDGLKNFGIDSPTAAAELMDEQRHDTLVKLVVRQRIDEFGVAEPVVQKAGTDRIIVELPGIDDPERAQDVVQKSAFLEFQISDETQALEKALPRLDEAARVAA